MHCSESLLVTYGMETEAYIPLSMHNKDGHAVTMTTEAVLHLLLKMKPRRKSEVNKL